MSTYKKAGVDIEAGYKFVNLIKPHTRRSSIPGILSGIGGFGSLFEIDTEKYRNPVLVSGSDGVGTKLKIAFQIDKHDTIGIDCVAMCANDILCHGAEPKIFLDYIAVDKLIPEKVAEIVKGVNDGCIDAGCALAGGETAEMPGIYSPDEYDIAGFCVGIVEKSKIIDADKTQVGDVLIGLPSSGFHSNGYSLVRYIFETDKNVGNLNKYIPELKKTLGEALLIPTKIYVRPVLSLIKKGIVNGIAHITGGGFYENIPRILHSGLRAKISRNAYDIPFLFDLIKVTGNLGEKEMYNTFNMGIGMVLAIQKESVDKAIDLLNDEGESPFILGEIVKGEKGIDIC